MAGKREREHKNSGELEQKSRLETLSVVLEYYGFIDV
jgi:hypothetical protein